MVREYPLRNRIKLNISTDSVVQTDIVESPSDASSSKSGSCAVPCKKAKFGATETLGRKIGLRLLGFSDEQNYNNF